MMNKMRKTLGQLFASQADDSADEKKKGTETPKNEEKADEATDADDDDDDDSEKEEKESGKEGEKKDQESKSAAEGTVTLALEDYDKLFALASETKTTRQANVALKAKADKWDAYKAALEGGKADSDSAGADSGKGDGNKAADEHADLRKKHGKLMDDI